MLIEMVETTPQLPRAFVGGKVMLFAPADDECIDGEPPMVHTLAGSTLALDYETYDDAISWIEKTVEQTIKKYLRGASLPHFEVEIYHARGRYGVYIDVSSFSATLGDLCRQIIVGFKGPSPEELEAEYADLFPGQ